MNWNIKSLITLYSKDGTLRNIFCKNNTIKVISKLILRMELIKTGVIMQMKAEVTEWGWKEGKCTVCNTWTETDNTWHFNTTSTFLFNDWLSVTYINGWNLNVSWEGNWEFTKKGCFRFQQGILLKHDINPQAKNNSSNTVSLLNMKIKYADLQN